MKTIQDLAAELSSLQNTEDKVFPLLKSFLYSEHFAAKLCKENNIDTTHTFVCNKCGNVTGSKQLSLNGMISSLIDKNILDQDSLEIFKLLNEIRNKLIHNISPNTDEIIQWIGTFRPPANDAIQQIINKANVWLRFYLCLIPAIANLYSKTKEAHIRLDSIEHNIPTGNWIFHFK
jgi:hypothetical protein